MARITWRQLQGLGSQLEDKEEELLEGEVGPRRVPLVRPPSGEGLAKKLTQLDPTVFVVSHPSPELW
jgi:hypothetical protein